jgi:hypothetical protein
MAAPQELSARGLKSWGLNNSAAIVILTIGRVLDAKRAPGIRTATVSQLVGATDNSNRF